MALAENPSKVQIEEYCKAVLMNNLTDRSGYDLFEWRKINTALYSENNVVTRFHYLLHEHNSNLFFIAILLDLLGNGFQTSFSDIIQDIHIMTNEEIMQEIDERVNLV